MVDLTHPDDLDWIAQGREKGIDRNLEIPDSKNSSKTQESRYTDAVYNHLQYSLDDNAFNTLGSMSILLEAVGVVERADLDNYTEIEDDYEVARRILEEQGYSPIQ